MKVGLIDVDGHNFSSLPLMKISAWHKRQGDAVQWYDPLTAWQFPPDRVYMSKVFTFTPDYPFAWDKYEDKEAVIPKILFNSCKRFEDFNERKQDT